MKVVCLHNGGPCTPTLTVNKIYEVVGGDIYELIGYDEETKQPGLITVINDYGKRETVGTWRFIALYAWREQQLDKII